MINKIKSHWLAIAGVVVAFLAYRSVTSQIAAVAAGAQATNANASLPQTPIYMPSGGGYADSVSPVTSATQSASNTPDMSSMMSALTTSIAANAAQQQLATTTAAQTATQATALNSSVSNTTANSFASVLSSFLNSPGSNAQTLDVAANPTTSGGVDLTASKNVNLNSAPTITQGAQYAPTAPLNNLATLTAAPAPAPAPAPWYAPSLPSGKITSLPQLNQIYTALLGRPADTSGASFYMGKTAFQIEKSIQGSQEYVQNAAAGKQTSGFATNWLATRKAIGLA